MTLLARILVGFVLLAHGLVHLLYLVRAPADPTYPFSLARSWLLPAPARRPVAFALLAGVVLGFVAAALAVWGVPGLAASWPGVTVAAAGLSLLLLVTFWDRQLWIGVLIDVLLVAVALVRPPWVDTLVS